MSKQGIKIALCLGLTGVALFAGNAGAMTAQECGSLPDNQFLAAIERGSCRIDIETAAGPDASYADNGDDGDDGHNGRNGGGTKDGGGNRSGGGTTGGGNGNGNGPAAGQP